MLTVKFFEMDGTTQTIKIQLPDYILSNFNHANRKPSIPVISGKMVLWDEANGLKSAIFIKGLLKKQTLFSTYYEANTPENQK